MSRPESPDARLERLTTEARAASAELAGLLKDIRGVVASARAMIDEYGTGEMQKALNKACDRVISETVRVCTEHEARVKERVIGYAALIEANFGREPLIREAADRIEAMIAEHLHEREQASRHAAGEILISLCDRPHAD